MGVREEAHKLLDDAIAKIKAAAENDERFDRLDAHAATVHMVFDEIPVKDTTPAPPPSAPAVAPSVAPPLSTPPAA